MARKTDNQVEGDGRAHKAGALDIRNVIGILLATYGVILVLLGLFGDTEPDKTGDVNANLWAGLVMLLIGAAFLVWARVRPLVVPHTTAD
jgi:uncharacterized membrane protein